MHLANPSVVLALAWVLLGALSTPLRASIPPYMNAQISRPSDASLREDYAILAQPRAQVILFQWCVNHPQHPAPSPEELGVLAENLNVYPEALARYLPEYRANVLPGLLAQASGSHDLEGALEELDLGQ